MFICRWRKALNIKMIFRIKNLRLRTIIGIHDWERIEKQDVIINAEFEFNAEKAAKSDKIEETLDYKKLNKEIIEVIESSQFFLIEKLADIILSVIMKYKGIIRAKVEVDKPGALRFADSVSVECTKEN